LKEVVEYNEAYIEAGGAGDQGMMFGLPALKPKP